MEITVVRICKQFGCRIAQHARIGKFTTINLQIGGAVTTGITQPIVIAISCVRLASAIRAREMELVTVIDFGCLSRRKNLRNSRIRIVIERVLGVFEFFYFHTQVDNLVRYIPKGIITDDNRLERF